MPKGNKVCPKCKERSGVRTKKCVCGYDFVFKEHTEESKERLFYPAFGNVLVIPAGECPIKIKDDDVVGWVKALQAREKKRTRNKIAFSAFRYWLRYMPIDPDDKNYYNDLLREAFRSGVLS